MFTWTFFIDYRMHIYRLASLTYVFLTLSATKGLLCPVQNCRCIDNQKIIDCRNRGLKAIPKITPSDLVFQEISFENSDDPSDRNNDNNADINRISTIQANAFKGLKVRKINLGRAGVQTLDQQSFSGLESDLEALVLGGNRLSPPPLDSLKMLKNLKDLELQNFVVPTLRKSFAIQSLLQLRSLKLVNMQLRFILKDSLEEFRSLKHLEVSGNRDMRFFPVGAIYSVPSLEELVLKDNGLVKVPGWAFFGLPNLKSLDLSRNQIDTLRPDAFRNVSNTLEKIDLTGNLLTTSSISEFSRYDWERLKNLRLLYNKITRIPINFSTKMRNLEFLELELNAISEITSVDFRPLTRLKYLDLSDNLITKIWPSALDLPAIQTLRLVNLNKNNAPVVIENAFRGPKQFLTSVALMENRFNAMDLWNEVARLKSVQELDLSDNGLTNLPRSAFANNTKVKTLTISNNNIGPYLSASQLDGLQASLQQLGLNSNGIQTIDSCLFTEFPNLHMVTLYGNPLSCDCRLRGLKTWMESLDFLYAYLTQAKCASPESVRGVMLTSAGLTGSGGGSCGPVAQC